MRRDFIFPVDHEQDWQPLVVDAQYTESDDGHILPSFAITPISPVFLPLNRVCFRFLWEMFWFAVSQYVPRVFLSFPLPVQQMTDRIGNRVYLWRNYQYYDSIKQRCTAVDCGERLPISPPPVWAQLGQQFSSMIYRRGLLIQAIKSYTVVIRYCRGRSMFGGWRDKGAGTLLLLSLSSWRKRKHSIYPDANKELGCGLMYKHSHSSSEQVWVTS